jgi:putative hydrolase of the HAD superfamily
VSNADVMEKAAWDDSPLAKYFDCVIFSCDVGMMKPDLSIYRMCLQKLKVEPVSCLYAGDGSHDELKSAQRLGMTTVLVTHVIKKMWPERLFRARSNADFEIERVSEILVITES